MYGYENLNWFFSCLIKRGGCERFTDFAARNGKQFLQGSAPFPNT
jgi:hypothetical protein